MDEIEFPDDAGEDGRSLTSAANGAKGGAPIKPRDYDADALAQFTAERVLTGRWPTRPHSGATPSVKDKEMLARFIGKPSDEFIADLSGMLQTIIQKTGDRVVERLDADEGKLSDLSYLLGVGIDKFQTLSGRTQQSQNVNIQINGNVSVGASREDLIASVKGIGGNLVA